MKKKSLPKRSEIPEELKWRLEDIYASDEEWERDFLWVKDQIPRLSGHQGHMGDSADALYAALHDYTQTMQKAEKVFVYAHMRKDEDNGNPKYQALLDRAQSLLVDIESTVSFMVPEILTIPEPKLHEFVSEKGELRDYRFYLEEITRQKEHILSSSEEQILAMSGEIASAPQQIFNMINNADIKFPVIKDENGNDVELTKGNYVEFMENRDRRVRQDAFTSLYSTYNKLRNTLASTLNYSIKKDVFYARVRKYSSALEASLDDDNIPISVYDNLIKAVEDNLDAMHRYVSLRKRALGLEELHMYDLYVPIVKDVDMKIPYEEAKEIVAEGVKPLGKEYEAVLREGYEGGWIDVLENQGKTSGAYAWGCYDTHPFVLLNYHESIDNVFTLAHEMGHAIHSYYSNKNQPYITAGYKIFVAEVASTLNELLLTEHLLNTLQDKQQRAYVLNHYLEQFRGTVYRQTMFAEFEKITHAMIERGEALTAENLCSIYHDLNVKYYGPDMVVDQEIDIEWARIPHFYTPFYVYKYATGFSAAAAIAQLILSEGQPAVNGYMEFLKSGGSDYPINLLKKAGVDMTTPDPISEGLKAFGRLVDEMEKLV